MKKGDVSGNSKVDVEVLQIFLLNRSKKTIPYDPLEERETFILRRKSNLNNIVLVSWRRRPDHHWPGYMDLASTKKSIVDKEQVKVIDA